MDMTGQPQLWTPAVEAATMQVLYEYHRGWSMHLAVRRCHESWGQRPATFYGGLTTVELLDVITAEWAVQLGLGDD